ncbi:(deoxy)nucleoside triphosphate pyrophosphohydrolase [Nitrospirales bacterium NOB]|nr:MAG: mutator protein MutT [Nitrospira sp. OLB3]MBV6469074.1 putative 8-oxo-dGTP diphosphatase 2 [Nitrospirota bacterium]MCE7965958.1 (deoxy)nucleoside triphosphate pyrophosphohydrolase [Nitrospira sp. NTP2]MCK6493276.1 (deoxy)nucleoside triphosphate pyrophosphohydrolase [Nitrospira sp.]MDL1890959.1 (deoxy)nucleoside triphosphate pyrophosphohydrolase [Nitrospirales bacterium NOB]MEB2338456.1 (deoxy)nucleoside triphosphate pyrophosphohydrolase [Nitrospirales bacterium]
MPETIEVAAGLILQGGRYLITRRKPEVHLGGLWEFPGGKREAGESLAACLARELWEELHVRIAPPIPFRVVRHEYPEKTVELHFFRCRIEAGEATAVDCAELRWVAPHEMASFEFPAADQAVIEALQQEAS